jgi:hypothetical protein
MENGSIRNPTAEELEQLKKKKLNTNIYKEEKIEHQKTETLYSTGEVKLKPKVSPFEPDPEPYRLITTNNVIKNNLTSNSEIFIRRMSGSEDAILANFSDVTGDKILEGITQIIVNCTKSDIDLRQLPLNEKMPLFIFILAISLGKTFDATPIDGCSTCGEDTKVFISITDDFKTNYMEPNSEYPVIVELDSYPGANIQITVELPKIGGENSFFKQGGTLKDYLDKMTQIVRKVVGTDSKGKPITDKEYIDVLTYLNSSDKEKISMIVNNWTENYGIIYKTKINNCNNPSCCMINKEVVFDPYEIIKKYVIRILTKQKKDF